MKRTVEVKYGITLHTKQMIKVNELPTGGNTSNLAKHLSRTNVRDRQVSKWIIQKETPSGLKLNLNE